MESKNTLYIDQLQLELLAELITSRIEKRMHLRQDKWMDTEEVMAALRISARSTIQDMRNRGQLRFAKLNSKNILYDRDSVNEYIEKRIREKF